MRGHMQSGVLKIYQWRYMQHNQSIGRLKYILCACSRMLTVTDVRGKHGSVSWFRGRELLKVHKMALTNGMLQLISLLYAFPSVNPKSFTGESSWPNLISPCLGQLPLVETLVTSQSHRTRFCSMSGGRTCCTSCTHCPSFFCDSLVRYRPSIGVIGFSSLYPCSPPIFLHHLLHYLAPKKVFGFLFQ